MEGKAAKKRRVAFEVTYSPPKLANGAKRPLSKKQKGKQKEVPSLQPATVASAASESLSEDLPSSFKIIAGSYERLLYGLEGHLDEEGVPTLKPIFIFPAHLSCVKALATSPHGGKWLVTGSADEVIKVWDLRRRKEVGGLIQHQGSITQLLFPTRSHMFSASEDGTIVAFRVKDWIPVRTLKGHTGRVNGIAIHHGLTVALSMGKDRMLRMWDLKKGKSVASMKLGHEGEVIQWSATGRHFAVLYESTIDIYSTQMKLVTVINHPKRLHDMRFLKIPDSGTEYLLVAAEDHKVSVYPCDFEQDEPDMSIKPHAAFVGHQNRVKAIDLLPVKSRQGNPRTLLATVSSDGLINVHDTTVLQSLKSSPLGSDLLLISPIASYDTKGTRLTCVVFAEGEEGTSSEPANGKKIRLEDLEGDIIENENETDLAVGREL